MNFTQKVWAYKGMNKRKPIMALSIFFSGVFWVLDSWVDHAVFREHATYLEAFYDPDPVELWMRMVVLLLMLLFGVVVRFYIVKQERLLQDLSVSKEQLESTVEKRTHQLAEAKMEAERMARTDSLTGIGNRRLFFEAADIEIKRAHRYERDLALIVFDIDHFKSVNDTHGHAAGDKAIVKAAEIAKHLLRGSDTFCRLGGDEFAILLPETNCRNAAEIANRLCRAYDEQSSPPIHFTSSIGVACLQKEDLDLDSVFERADRALYTAKHEGRNQVVSVEFPFAVQHQTH